MGVSDNYLIYKACAKLFGYDTPDTNNLVNTIDKYFSNIFKNLNDYLNLGKGIDIKHLDILFEYIDDTFSMSKDEFIDMGFILINDFNIDISQKDFLSLIETHILYNFNKKLNIVVAIFDKIEI